MFRMKSSNEVAAVIAAISSISPDERTDGMSGRLGQSMDRSHRGNRGTTRHLWAPVRGFGRFPNGGLGDFSSAAPNPLIRKGACRGLPAPTREPGSASFFQDVSRRFPGSVHRMPGERPCGEVMTMTYWLGIDLGTTYTVAALCRPAVDELETHVLPLGSRSPAVPSVLFLPGDGSLVVGEGAERRALTDPDRVVREFKSRVGDEIPMLVAGSPYYAHELAAVLVHWVWQRVTKREGQPPEGVALTCPASWGPHKIRLFMQAVQATRIGEMTRLGHAELLSEPQAAAIGYASREPVEVGAHLAVYDLGGVAL